jgi:thermitase
MAHSRLALALAAVATAFAPTAAAAHGQCAGNPACAAPNDPLFAQQWALQNDAATIQPAADRHPVAGADIDAPFAWSITTGDPRTRIAIVDSGIDPAHEDLRGEIVASHTFKGSADGRDNVGHGTAVAGLAAAITNNGKGIAGVSHGASLLNAKVSDDPGGETTCSVIGQAIIWGTDNGANVINVSSGGPAGCFDLNLAVNYAASHDVLIVAAAGNAGDTAPNYPAAYPTVLSVAATDNADARWPSSSYGAAWVDLAAPGVDVLTTLPEYPNSFGVEGYGEVRGTSFAAPLVAGAAALLWPITKDENGDGRKSDDVAARLEKYADPIPGTGSDWAAGRLNVCRAVAAGAKRCPPPAAAKPITRAAARRHAVAALERHFGKAFRQRRAYRLSCALLDDAHARCTVSWRHARRRYRGTVSLARHAGGQPEWTSRLRIKRSRPT